MYDNWIDAISNEILNDDEIASRVCPGFIENWDKAISDVIAGRMPEECCSRRRGTEEYELELDDNYRRTTQNKNIRQTIYPIIRIEIGLKQVFLELFCPFCGASLVLRQNRKTGVTFFG